ncbi:MAG: response regulator [Candidatus Sumerlaeota bacterium]|nr:response regulator [Candidatus Sumerlaeota bacterium]
MDGQSGQGAVCEQELAGAGEAKTDRSFDPLTVLVIDDEEIIRDLLHEFLSREGYTVATAASGAEGLEQFRRHRPMLVVTDVCMPGMDGLAFLRAVRREEPEARVVVMTGHGDDAVALEALRGGATNYIKKPLTLEEFLFIVRAHERMCRAQERQRLPLGALVDERRTYSLPNDSNLVYPVAYQVTQTMLNFLPRQDVEAVSLALTEAMINAMEHGNLGIGYQQKSDALHENRYRQLLSERQVDPVCAARHVLVESHVGVDGSWFRVTDEGEGFDWRNLPDPSDPENLLREHGRGPLSIGNRQSSIGNLLVRLQDRQQRHPDGQIHPPQDRPFQPQQLDQEGVDGFGQLDQIGLRPFGAAPKQPLREPKRDDRREQQGDGVRIANRPKPRLAQQSQKRTVAIAPEVMERFVVLAPQERVRGHGDHHPGARRGDPPKLGEQGAVVGHVLDEIQRQDHVE